MDRYEEALERAKKGLPIDEVFPELKESEDERIRKFLVELVSNDKANNYNGLYKDRGVRFDDVLSYLEKQKEQKPIPSLDRGDEIILKAICEELKDAPGWVERIEGWYSLAKDAQQPAEWSEEDEKMHQAILQDLANIHAAFPKVNIQPEFDWLKSLKNRGNSQNRRED